MIYLLRQQTLCKNLSLANVKKHLINGQRTGETTESLYKKNEKLLVVLSRRQGGKTLQTRIKPHVPGI